jgi:hypothetical protein
MSMPVKPLTLALAFSLVSLSAARGDEAPNKAGPTAVKVATFDVDATPPLGSAMAYDPVKRLDELTLRCRGVVILGAGKPIVLCAVDWIGIANEGHDRFRETLAHAAGTTRDRVAGQAHELPDVAEVSVHERVAAPVQQPVHPEDLFAEAEKVGGDQARKRLVPGYATRRGSRLGRSAFPRRAGVDVVFHFRGI